MKKIQITAKNVQKAIEQGLKELNATQDEVDIKILDEGGFFKKAKVELILDKEVEEKQAEEEKAKAEKEQKRLAFVRKSYLCRMVSFVVVYSLDGAAFTYRRYNSSLYKSA